MEIGGERLRGPRSGPHLCARRYSFFTFAVTTFLYLGTAAVLLLLAWLLRKSRQPAAATKPLRAGPAYQPHGITTPFKPVPYEKVVRHYEQALARQLTAPRFRLLLMAHYNAQAYEAALAVSQRFQQALAAEFVAADLVLHAHLHTCVGEPQRAVALYTHMLAASVASAATGAAIYNNRGYAYNMMGDYLLAIQDFNQALALKPNMAYAYNNRGLAWHRLGMSPEGRADIERSLRLNSQNAYAYRNLGIYYFDQGDYAAALPLFERAHRIGTAPPELAAYLRQTRQQLGFSAAADEPPLMSES